MAIFDIFKKKKEKKEKIVPPVKREKPKKEAKPAEKPKVKKPAEFVAPKVKRKTRDDRAWRILKSLHVTEKATDLAKANQYVFKVFAEAGKPEIKKAVEDIYGVDVVSVKIINILAKKRRLGRIEGWRKGYKKAIIRIKEGQKIEVLPR
jgi:large subunit ribosomal protein L23